MKNQKKEKKIREVHIRKGFWKTLNKTAKIHDVTVSQISKFCILSLVQKANFKMLPDIALLSQKLVDPKDLKDLRSRTSEFKLGLAMEKALKLAQFWNGIRLPEGYDDFTRLSKPDKAEKVELEYVTNNHATDIRLCGYLETLRESPNKIRYLMKFLFPPPDYIRATHPPSRIWLLPFSYVRRWAHWIGKLFRYGLHAWQTEHTPK